MKRLVLLGAGHAHLMVLRQFAQAPPPDTELVLITPSLWQYYSGMIPGWVEGHYSIDQCRIAVEPQVSAAGGRLILDRALRLAPQQRQLELASGQSLSYDLMSIDIGSTTRLDHLADFDGRLLSVKPIEAFSERWAVLRREVTSEQSQQLVVLGGGAAGVELTLAMASSLGCVAAATGPWLSLVTGAHGLLPDFNHRLRQRAHSKLTRMGVRVIEQGATSRHGRLQLAGGTPLNADLVIAATGACPVNFVAESDLTLDAQGFILVDRYHRSLSHPEVFAVGDTCSRADGQLNRSGVHAVRAGPVLARNLAAVLAGKSPVTAFNPRPYSLYLLASGDRTAIGSYGPLTFSGRWVWWWKDRIDRRFVAGFMS